MVLALAASLLWIIGLGWIVNDQFFKKTEALELIEAVNETIQHAENLKIIALGDSLTRGTGDVSGEGYIGYVMDDLKEKTDEEIHLSNVSIKGQTSKQLIDQLQEPEIQRQLKQASIIVMTIGGNDLFQSGQALGNFSVEQIDEARTAYLKNLQSIFTKVRELNEEAAVFHIGLYNPFNDLTDASETSKIVREWNFDSAETAAKYKNIVFVPTFDLFQLHVNNYLYSDKFHPNSEGYQLIGERLAALITFSEGEDTNEE
ncbi:GDSL family lipase [Bacillus taeanensis]|uniref:GDSL family lipase n=2 Tax=Bacillus taeanensis TaxID=273032 RepID=A0A366XWL6_9BACI|nr:GDSL family lipase [Bacillus taeanensis]